MNVEAGVLFFFLFYFLYNRDVTRYKIRGINKRQYVLEGLLWIVYFLVFQHYIYASLLILRTSQYTGVIKIKHLTIVFTDEAVLMIDCK